MTRSRSQGSVFIRTTAWLTQIRVITLKVAPAVVDNLYVRSSPGVHWDELRRAQHGAARVEFALMVAIFVTWIIVSVAMFQQGVREVYTGATGAVAAEGTPPTTGGPTTPAARTAPTVTAAPTPAAPTTAPAAAAVPTTQAPAPAVTVTVMPAPAEPAAAPAVPAPAVPVPRLTAPTKEAPTRTPPTTEAPTRTAPTTAAPTRTAPTTAAPTTAAPVEAPADAAPAAAPTVAAPPPVAPTTAAPEPVAGPRLVLTAAIAKKGTLAANLLSGLSPAATLAGIGVTSGRGELVWSTANGDYVFNAPSGRDTTVITFTYAQGPFNVTGNTLTISTE